MPITATELKKTNPYQNRVDTAKSLFGILPENADFEEERKERLKSEIPLDPHGT